MRPPERELEPVFAKIFRDEWARLVSTAIRMVGDMDRAEEIVQEALLVAVERWPVDGVPERPGAWLMTTVRRRAVDELRARQRQRSKHEEIAFLASDREMPFDPEQPRIADDRLRLVFICSHPLLAGEARIALTLRLVGGLTTREIARAFLVNEATISQRIVRAKRTIRERGLEYRVPEPPEWTQRLPAVLEVVYLIFNEGYSARDGDDLVRLGLCDEAIRLQRLLAELIEDDPEVFGLLALLEFQASRQATRIDTNGELVLLQDQDRSRWDRLQIERGSRHLAAARRVGALGLYGLQALIAECHARAPSWQDTHWGRIIQFYDALVAVTDSPVVKLNRSVAVAMLRGPAAALAIVDDLADEKKLRGYALLPATRADFLRRLGRLDEAAGEYARAIDLTSNERERAYLRQRLEECEA